MLPAYELGAPSGGYMKIKTKTILSLCFVLLCVFCAVAETRKCFVCENEIKLGDQAFYEDNHRTGSTNYYCTNCAHLPHHCFVCGANVAATSKELPDGRYLCPHDAAEVVRSDEESKQICKDVVDDINRQFARWMDFPSTNALVSIGNSLFLNNLVSSSGAKGVCEGTYGATVSNPMNDGSVIHSIAILSDILKPQIMATCAHEFTHAYIGQNKIRTNRKPKMINEMEEAFCELVSYKYMETKGETVQLQAIEKNGYTKGKFKVLLEADRKYGFNAVLEWIKGGEDEELTLDHLERIRAVNGATAPPSDDLYANLIVGSSTKATPQLAATNLVLKSISGAGNHRFAMINSTTFEPMEKAKVRLGATNVLVQCLEIKDASVIIHVDGTKDNQTLALTSAN